MNGTEKRIDFAQALSETLYKRWDSIVLGPMQNSKVYVEAQAALDSAIEKVEAMIPDGNKPDILWELSECYQRVHDIETQCFYRLGIQDGISIGGEQFLIDSL